MALFGDVEVPVAVSALVGGRTTRVHRTADIPTVEVPCAEGYLDFLAGHGIVVDPSHRREQIVTAAQQLVARVGGTVDFEDAAPLLAEITNLVEQPTTILGHFAERYLELPAEILTTVMRKHQRYLPVRDPQGNLIPYFIAVANGSCDQEVVRAGNEAVLRARYEDAAFFWRADLQVAPDQLKIGLDQLAFEERLGSMADRTNRIATIVRAIALPATAGTPLVELTNEDQGVLARAAELAKFDLASQMVIELTSLAGVMAREYARRAGESEAVAQALFEMELPRSASDAVPETTPGALLALADRLDLLVGLFGIGATPTGSSDPFGLRRAALGVVSILRAFPELRGITLSKGLEVAAGQFRHQGVDLLATAVSQAREFILRRYEQQLLDAGHHHEFVAAVLPLAEAPAAADEALGELTRRADNPEFADLVAALQRLRRIVPVGTVAGYQPEKLSEPTEVALHDALRKVSAVVQENPTLGEFADAATALTDPINTFFDDILVMADDPEIRTTRLGLLASISELAGNVIDWTALGTAIGH